MAEHPIGQQNTASLLLPIPQVRYAEDDVGAVIQKVLKKAAEDKAAQENREIW